MRDEVQTRTLTPGVLFNAQQPTSNNQRPRRKAEQGANLSAGPRTS